MFLQNSKIYKISQNFSTKNSAFLTFCNSQGKSGMHKRFSKDGPLYIIYLIYKSHWSVKYRIEIGEITVS